MKRVFYAIWEDWRQAPISGTMVILAQLMAAYQFVWTGEWERGMIWLILGAVWNVQREQLMKKMERHPACVAPHCLRGGKCTGPCKVDR